MPEVDQLKKLSHYILSLPQVKLVSDIEIYSEWGNKYEVSVRNGEVQSLLNANTYGVGIRVFKDFKVGFGYSTDLSETSLNGMVNQIIESVNYSGVDEANKPTMPQTLHGDFSNVRPETRFSNSESCINLAKALEGEIKNASNQIKQVEETSISKLTGGVLITNNSGLKKSESFSYFGLSAQAIASDDDGNQISGWHELSHNSDGISSVSDFAKKTVHQTVSLLNAKKPKTGNYPIIFESEAAQQFWSQLFPAFSGEHINKGSSFLVNDLSKPIASNVLTVTDHPAIQHGLFTTHFDGEGIDCEPLPIISNGILTKFAYDSYQGNKSGNKSTGHAVRTFKSNPSVGFHQLVVTPGKSTLDNLMQIAGKGLIIRGTIGFGVDTVTGTYSKGAFGFYFENGEIKYSVKDFTIAGNLRDMLRHMVAIGNDESYFSKVISPSFLISEMTVAGA